MFFTQRLCHMRTRHIQQPLNFDRNVREKDLSLPQPTLCEDCLMSELMHLQQSKSPCLIFQEGKVHIVFLLELYMSKQTEAERSGIQAAAVDAHTWIFSLTNAFPTEDWISFIKWEICEQTADQLPLNQTDLLASPQDSFSKTETQTCWFADVFLPVEKL